MALTPEQRADAARAEAALASKHKQAHNDAVKAVGNQRKNGKLYAKLAEEATEKTGRDVSRVRVFRQCPLGADPMNYTLKKTTGYTFFRVQYMLNVDENGKGINGKAKHVLKITWSDHYRLGKRPEYQSTVYMNLFDRYDINEKAKEHCDTLEEAKAIKQRFKELAQINPPFPEHIVKFNMFGYTTVQVEQGGTQSFMHNQAELIPTSDEAGKFKAVLNLYINGQLLQVIMHDVTQRKTKDGLPRAHNAAKMVGFHRSNDNQMLLASIAEKFKRKEDQDDEPEQET